MPLEEPRNTEHLKRWANCQPDGALTWGEVITADNYIKLGVKYGIFAKDRAILELGPGYGRIFKSVLSLQAPFSFYTAIDISENNLQYLASIFQGEKINFIHGGFEDVVLVTKYDVVLSSLVLKHQFPTFEKSLANIVKYVNSGGVLFFDLLENGDDPIGNTDLNKGPKKFMWEKSTWHKYLTFIGYYTQKEVELILGNLGLQLIAFDHVIHAEKYGQRLIVVARKP